MTDNLLNQIGRLALVALVAALTMFAADLAGILPGLSGLGTLIVTALIGLVSFFVERLRDLLNQGKTFTIQQVEWLNRIGRAAIVALVSGLVVLGSGIAELIPELAGFAKILVSVGAGVLSLLIEYLRDYFNLPEKA